MGQGSRLNRLVHRIRYAEFLSTRLAKQQTVHDSHLRRARAGDHPLDSRLQYHKMDPSLAKLSRWMKSPEECRKLLVYHQGWIQGTTCCSFQIREIQAVRIARTAVH